MLTEMTLTTWRNFPGRKLRNMLTDMTYFFPFELLSYKPVTETPPLLINEISSFLAVFRQKKKLRNNRRKPIIQVFHEWKSGRSGTMMLQFIKPRLLTKNQAIGNTKRKN
jgi:hypothetical protein